MRRGRDDVIHEDKIGGATVGFIPAGGELVAESDGEREFRGGVPDILEIPGAEECTPVHFSGRGVIKEAADGALEELLESGESSLAELGQSEIFVGLELLEPGTGAEVTRSSPV